MADFDKADELRRHINRSISEFKERLPPMVAKSIAEKMKTLGKPVSITYKDKEMSYVDVEVTDKEQREKLAKITRNHVINNLKDIAEDAWPDWG